MKKANYLKAQQNDNHKLCTLFGSSRPGVLNQLFMNLFRHL